MTWLRIAWRELINNKRFAIFFCANFALGLTGFVVLDAYKNSLHQELSNGSRAMLSADFTVKSSNRVFNPLEKDVIAKQTEGLQKSSDIRLFSMVASEKQTRLVRVIGLGKAYPLVGQFLLEDGRTITGDMVSDLETGSNMWVYPDVLAQLDVKLGDTVRLGGKDFKITAVVTKDSSGAGSSFNFAPRVYVDLDKLLATGLVEARSRFSVNEYFTHPDEYQWRSALDALKAELSSPDITVSSHEEESQELARSLTHLNDYLGLIALVALFLAAIGGAYLFRSFLVRKLEDIATILSLGGTYAQVRRMYIYQLILLGMISATFSLILSSLALKGIPALTQGLLPLAVAPTLSVKVVIAALFVGIVGSVLICLPLLVFLSSVKPGQLFAEARQLDIHWTLPTIVAVLPGGFLYWILAIWESNSYKVGSLFVVGLGAFCLIFGVISRQLFAFGARFARHLSMHWRLAIRNLARNHLSTASCFLTISLATMLMTIVPQVRDVILEEMSSPSNVERPSLFLADVQDDQVEPVTAFFKERGVEIQNVSPMVRARLLKLDGKEYDKFDDESKLTREEQARQWARTRGQNLTYREKTNSAERILEGREFSGVYDWEKGGPAEISIEMRYARRLNVGVGSVLSFDVQGVPVEGVIVNIRRVRWTSFQPNFFILFQPGVFDEAPKTHLASIGSLPDTQKNSLQTDLVQKFPNISIVDLASTINTVLGIMSKMEWIVQVMAFFAIFAGFVVLFSIATIQAHARRWDVNLFKILGAEFGDIRKLVILEFGLLGFFAALTGVLASFVSSWVFAKMVFDSPYTASLVGPSLVLLFVTLLTIVVALLATGKILREKPLEILRGQ